jgi:hypothetical protein
MKQSLIFSTIYHVAFAIFSLSITVVFEGIGEIFAGIFWFNMIYFVFGLVFTSIIFNVGTIIFRTYFKLMLYQFILSILVVNILFYYLDRSFVTVSLFSSESEPKKVSIVTHAIVIISILISALVSRKKPFGGGTPLLEQER